VRGGGLGGEWGRAERGTRQGIYQQGHVKQVGQYLPSRSEPICRLAGRGEGGGGRRSYHENLREAGRMDVGIA
jgi:hypothetical protein